VQQDNEIYDGVLVLLLYLFLKSKSAEKVSAEISKSAEIFGCESKGSNQRVYRNCSHRADRAPQNYSHGCLLACRLLLVVAFKHEKERNEVDRELLVEREVLAMVLFLAKLGDPRNSSMHPGPCTQSQLTLLLWPLVRLSIYELL
jgi:hypothetical protein